MTRSIDDIGHWVYRIHNFLWTDKMNLLKSSLADIVMQNREAPDLFWTGLWVYPIEESASSIQLFMPIVQEALELTQILFERFLQEKLFLNNQIHILELKPGQNISIHTHDTIYLQGVLHFQSLRDGGGGELEFYSADKQLIASLSPIEDSAILFLGTTNHAVNTNTSTTARYSMSFGYKLVGSSSASTPSMHSAYN